MSKLAARVRNMTDTELCTEYLSANNSVIHELALRLDRKLSFALELELELSSLEGQACDSCISKEAKIDELEEQIDEFELMLSRREEEINRLELRLDREGGLE